MFSSKMITLFLFVNPALCAYSLAIELLVKLSVLKFFAVNVRHAGVK